MSNWISITEADLKDALVAAEVEACQTAALASGQSDPTSRSIQDVVDRIRRKIASNAANSVDADETKIPRGLKLDAVMLILCRMKGRLEMDLSKYQETESARIETDLNRIAAGTDSVEQPDDAIESPAQPATPSPQFSTPTRKFSRCDADGL